MYPASYYETYMRYEASNEVFVAMPFTAEFRRAFDGVIEPAITSVHVRELPLAARIINRGTSGSPDIHEKIFDAIVHSRLVIADMTVQASYSGDDQSMRWQPNSNVAYEVGLACAWRNPESILLVHQPRHEHVYSFDVQNLRHFEYNPGDRACAASLSQEIASAINKSEFLARRTYQKILQTVSPSAVQFMHQEANRAFPVISFKDGRMPIMNTRIHAATELLGCGALKNRTVLRQGGGKGPAVVYEWSELGLKMMSSLLAITPERRAEMAAQIASVAEGDVPPQRLLDLPQPEPGPQGTDAGIDMVKAAEVDTTDPATST